MAGCFTPSAEVDAEDVGPEDCGIRSACFTTVTKTCTEDGGIGGICMETSYPTYPCPCVVDEDCPSSKDKCQVGFCVRGTYVVLGDAFDGGKSDSSADVDAGASLEPADAGEGAGAGPDPREDGGAAGICPTGFHACSSGCAPDWVAGCNGRDRVTCWCNDGALVHVCSTLDCFSSAQQDAICGPMCGDLGAHAAGCALAHPSCGP